TRLDGLFAIEGTPAEAVADASGRLTLVLPPRSGQVWRLPVGTRVAAEGGPPTAPTTGLDVEPLPDAVQRGDFTVRGRAPGRRQVRVVVDGDLASAQDVAVGADGRWSARVRTGGMIEPEAMHRVVAFDPAGGQASGAREFHVEHDWRLLADVADLRGDDSGPDGRYTYPAGGAWRTLRPADILRVRAWGASGALRVELTMRALSQAWNPANGFDHVAITGYLQLPGRDGGLAAMPLQNASLPADMRWHYRLRSHGWSNVLSRTEGAG